VTLPARVIEELEGLGPATVSDLAESLGEPAYLIRTVVRRLVQTGILESEERYQPNVTGVRRGRQYWLAEDAGEETPK
jgi:DNA-binding IclR family transcriptional regulator